MKKLNKSTLAVLLATTVTAPFASAYEAGDIIIRAGATTVAPDTDSDSLTLNGSVSALNSFLKTSTPSSLDVDNSTQLGLTATYMLDSNWGVELLAATPFQHTAAAKGALASAISDVADTKQLPPTLSAVYHFDAMGQFQPYVGVGINYTLFFDEQLTTQADTTLSSLNQKGGKVKLDNSWGLAVQVGADYHLDEKWLINASVRWIDIDTTAEIKFDNGNVIAGDLELDPMVYTLSVGYKY